MYRSIDDGPPKIGEKDMPRAGYLILLALLLAAAAAGVLVWTKYLEIPGMTQPAAPTVEVPSPETEIDWTKQMSEWATNDGLVLSFTDKDTSAWSITDGHKLERFRVAGGTQVYARLSSSVPLNPEDRLSGLQVKLPVEWAQKVNGKRFEIGVVARQPQSNAATDFSFLYATMQEGNSGWRTYQLSPTFVASKFNFDVPPLPGGYQNAPLVVIRADSAGQDKAIELVGVYLKPLP